MIPLLKGKYIVGGLWFIGFLILFIIITAQTVSGDLYGARNKEAWEWLTPHLLPTMGLILGVLISDWKDPSSVKGVKIGYAQVLITFLLSLLHLGILLYVMLFAVGKQTIDETFTALKSANLPLGFIQGLVALSLGMFFKK